MGKISSISVANNNVIIRVLGTTLQIYVNVVRKLCC